MSLNKQHGKPLFTSMRRGEIYDDFLLERVTVVMTTEDETLYYKVYFDSTVSTFFGDPIVGDYVESILSKDMTEHVLKSILDFDCQCLKETNYKGDSITVVTCDSCKRN